MTPAEKVVASLEEKPDLLKEVIGILRLKGHIMPHISPEPDWGPARLAARFAKPVPDSAPDERYSFRQSLCDGCGDRPHPHRDCL